jgi:hypothetical protein
MSEGADRRPVDLKVDQTNLYREEVFTDLKVATIRKLTPVKQDGSLDKARPVLFVGQTQVMTPAGAIPVDASIQATNLQEAMERFPVAVNRAIEQMVSEIEELRRREASRIVVPPTAGGKILMP